MQPRTSLPKFVKMRQPRVLAQHFPSTPEVVENTRLARVVADVAADVRQLVTQVRPLPDDTAPEHC